MMDNPFTVGEKVRVLPSAPWLNAGHEGIVLAGPDRCGDYCIDFDGRFSMCSGGDLERVEGDVVLTNQVHP